MRISVFVLVWARYVPVGCRKLNSIESEYKKNNQTNETHCTFLLKLRPVAHIVMYNLKAEGQFIRNGLSARFSNENIW